MARVYNPYEDREIAQYTVSPGDAIILELTKNNVKNKLEVFNVRDFEGIVKVRGQTRRHGFTIIYEHGADTYHVQLFCTSGNVHEATCELSQLQEIVLAEGVELQ